MNGTDWSFSRQSFKPEVLPLYRLEDSCKELLNGEPIILCESESSVDALLAQGFPATTWAGSASAIPAKTLVNSLTGLPIIIVPDNDQAGLKCLDKLTDILKANVQTLRVKMPETGKDARDMLNTLGHSSFDEWVYAP